MKRRKTKDIYDLSQSEHAKYLRSKVISKLTEMLEGNVKLAEECLITERRHSFCLAHLRWKAIAHVMDNDVTKPSLSKMSAAVGLCHSTIRYGLLQLQTSDLKARGLA